MNLSSLSCFISGSTISELIGHKGSRTNTILKSSLYSMYIDAPLELFFIEKLTSSFSELWFISSLTFYKTYDYYLRLLNYGDEASK